MLKKTIAQLQNKLPETSSFDDIITTSDSQDFTAKDLLEDKDTLDPQSLYYQERMQEKIQNAISKLDAREADIIRNYFGLNESHESRNFAQIAEKLGLSRERVRQIQKEALKKIMREIKPEEDEFVDRFLEKYHY